MQKEEEERQRLAEEQKKKELEDLERKKKEEERRRWEEEEEQKKQEALLNWKKAELLAKQEADKEKMKEGESLLFTVIMSHVVLSSSLGSVVALQLRWFSNVDYLQYC